MVWGRRRFQSAEYVPYQDRLQTLQTENATRYREFMMFAIEEQVGLQNIYIGVPTNELLAVFDGFEPVSEAALPRVVDTLLLADFNAFGERFEFRHNKNTR